AITGSDEIAIAVPINNEKITLLSGSVKPINSGERYDIPNPITKGTIIPITLVDTAILLYFITIDKSTSRPDTSRSKTTARVVIPSIAIFNIVSEGKRNVKVSGEIFPS